MWLRPQVAVAVVWASSCSCDSTLTWELPYAVGVALKKTKKSTTLRAGPGVAGTRYAVALTVTKQCL